VSGSPEFYALDASSSASGISALGSLEASTSQNGVIVRSGLAFLVGESSDGFHVLDIHEPAHMTIVASSSLPNMSLGSAIDCEGNDLFVTSRDALNNGYLSLITSAP
jgi:hypothetical protein